jgi:hypothetical protein
MEVDWAFSLLCTHYFECAGVVQDDHCDMVMRQQWLVNRNSGDLFRS